MQKPRLVDGSNPPVKTPIYILLHPSPLANNNNNKQQATSNKHVSMPFWPLLRPNASDPLPM